VNARRDLATVKILAHAGAITGLYLAFSSVLFLGLQVNPLYGSIGLVAFGILVASYVYFGFIRKQPRRRSAERPP